MSEEQSRDQAPPRELDVAQLLAQVEASVQEKKASGFYDPAEVRRVDQAAVSLAAAAQDGALAEAALRHANLQRLWDAKVCGVTTHRGGLAGRLLVSAKRLLHKITKPYLGIALAQQVAFNDELVKLLNVLVPQYAELRGRQRQSESDLESLFQAQGRNESRLTRHDELLHAQAQTNQEGEARLSSLERQAGRGAAQNEELLARLQEFMTRQAAAGAAAPQAAREVSELRAQSRGASYLAFEDLHRGSREEIKERQGVYIPHFRPALDEQHPLLDLGCGRGEFLELCREQGLPARGVDMNPEMAAFCREQGLDVQAADGLAHLRSLAPESLGGILMSQVIEHLTLDQLTELTALAASRLRPGGVLIAETVNPQSLSTFAGAFYLDLTHVKPIHPEAARFLWRWAGLGQVEILYLSPVPEAARLEPLPSGEEPLLGAFNRNVARLNQLLYGPLDYAVKGSK